MYNKEMRKEFEIWAKENYLKIGVDKEDVPHMFELYKDGTYNFYGVDIAYAAYVSYLEGYKTGNKLKEESLAEMTKPIWTWKDKCLKILPEVGSEIVGDISKIVYEVVKRNNSGYVVASTNDDGVITTGYYTKEEIMKSFNPHETPQQKYNREMEEYVKTIADKDPVCRHSIYDFEEELKQFINNSILFKNRNKNEI